MTKRNMIASVLVTLGLAACAKTASPELVDARAAYARASTGPAQQNVPAEVQKAKVSLEKAELAFNQNSPDQRDYAYVAERKSQLAEALSMRAEHAAARAKAEAQLAKDKDANHNRTKDELDRTRTNLTAAEQIAADEKRRAAESDSKAAASATLAADAAAKAAEADKRAAEADLKLKAMQIELAKWAAVKEEPRGVVITLSGSVLFASDKAALLPAARNRLGQVTAALLETKDRRLDVQGFTDSQGKDAYNVDLSQRRADAVRTYLVAGGYPPDLIVASGMGKASPVAENTTAEGRANNRRVEIIIAPKKI
ncbi:MAG: OmpA family protein [Deltaproteobacteria bacterium]|nr:OmpA family protein [Deltaproteobacteria bacterium]